MAWVQGTEQEATVSCRPLTASLVRMLAVVAFTPSATVDSGLLPSLDRVTVRAMESPGSRPAVVAGIGAAGWARSMETVPEVSWADTGVVESVKVPKVPRPATAAAVPITAREPRTLRVVPRVLLLIGVAPDCGAGSG